MTPKLGDRIFVWPALRTVRDAARQPVKNADGTVQKKAAYVRGSHGAVIVDREYVIADLHTIRLINSRNLEWCTPEQQREFLQAQTQQPANTAAPAPRTERNKKQATAEAVENTSL